jgi:hypothetical protein
MYKTIFDISTETPSNLYLPVLIVGAVAILFPLAVLLFWIRFRNVIMGPRTSMYLGIVSLDEQTRPIYNAYRALLKNCSLVVLCIISVIGLLLGGGIILGTYMDNQRYVSALQDHTALTVEGPIEQFQAYPNSNERISIAPRAKTESFSVENVVFVYSRDFTDAGFQGSEESSATLAEAKTAKVWYINNPDETINKKIILKLQVQ